MKSTVGQMKGRASCGPLGNGSRSKRVKAKYRAYRASRGIFVASILPLREFAYWSDDPEARAWLEAKRSK